MPNGSLPGDWSCGPQQTRLAAHKYLMHSYKASVRGTINGRSQIVKTEVRAPSAQDARWLQWAMYGFHSILSGPTAA
ncbi:MAG: hypothetical protein RLZZ153_2542 [Pseudomonadota bacterium]|jgi:hypothetical protein